MKKFEDYIKIANRDIQFLEEKCNNELKEYVASLLYRNGELEEENKKLKAEVDLLDDNRHYLNNKIGKAIKYIEKHRFNFDDFDIDKTITILKKGEK